MKDYVGHHSCSKNGGEQYVLENAPFLSQYNKNDPKTPFLGTGYYFWEFDEDQAIKWGRKRYKYFYVVEGTIHTNDQNFLDLVGDKKHMGYLLLVANKFVRGGIIEKNWKLGELIEYLKRIRVHNPNAFPYSIIRAEDCTGIEHKRKYYFRDNQNFTYLDSRSIFCLLQVNSVILSNKRIIFQSKNR